MIPNPKKEDKYQRIVVNLPFKVLKVTKDNKNIQTIANQIAKLNPVLKFDTKHVKDVKLEISDTPCLLLKKKIYRNKLTDETKEVYDIVSRNNSIYDHTCFSDFMFQSGVNPNGVVNLFERILSKKNSVGHLNEENDFDIRDREDQKNIETEELNRVKEELEIMKKHFKNLFSPTSFCKEFAWGNYPIE